MNSDELGPDAVIELGRLRSCTQACFLNGNNPNGIELRGLAHPSDGSQKYGSCPLHVSTSRHRRSFSVNVSIGRYFCRRCHSHGNQLELWAAATKLALHQAVINLCHRLGRDIPWIERW